MCTLQALLDARATVDPAGDDGFTPLQLATSKLQMNCVYELIARGAAKPTGRTSGAAGAEAGPAAHSLPDDYSTLDPGDTFSMDPYSTLSTVTTDRPAAPPPGPKPAAAPGSNTASKNPSSSPAPADSIERESQKLSGSSGLSGRPLGSGNIDVMRWEVQYSDLKFKEILGKGSFGKVRGGPGPIHSAAFADIREPIFMQAELTASFIYPGLQGRIQ